VAKVLSDKKKAEEEETSRVGAPFAVALIAVGIMLAWFALYIMLATFYESLVELNVAIIEGGTYKVTYMRGEPLFIWIGLMIISSILLAFGFEDIFVVTRKK